MTRGRSARIERTVGAAAAAAAAALLLTTCSGPGRNTPSVVSSGAATQQPSCTVAWAVQTIPLPPGARGASDAFGSAQPQAIEAMAANSASDVWAVGGVRTLPQSGSGVGTALVEHWDGSGWHILDTPTIAATQFDNSSGVVLTGVAAVAADDVWAVGWYASAAPDSEAFGGWHRTLVEHWDGNRWRTVAAPDLTPDDELTGISVVRPNDIWAVGDAHYPVVEPANPAFPAEPASYVYVTEPLAEHWDGTRWSIVQVPAVGIDPSDSAAVLSHNSDGTIRDGLFNAVHAASSTDVWAVGNLTPDGVVRSAEPARVPTTFIDHWDGSRWTNVAAPDQSVPELGHDASDTLLAVDGTAASGVWAVGAATPLGTLALHTTGTAWSIVPSPQTGYVGYFADVAVIGPSNVWAAGDSVAHWDGRAWSDIPTVNGTSTGAMRGMAVVNANDIWFAGQTSFLHYECGIRTPAP